jgi:hypothetical protein
LILAVSCSKSDTDVQDFGYDYYPVVKGKYVVYNVVELVYNDFDMTVDTSIFQLKESIDSADVDLEGRNIFHLIRYTRVSDTLDWKISENWTVYKGTDRLEINESNVTFVKMSFPLRRAKTWDGNALNSLDAQIYTILNLDLMVKKGKQVVDKTTRINHRSNVNLIEKQVKEEVYANGIGLIELIDTDLKYNTDGSILSGRTYEQTYLEHGTE